MTRKNMATSGQLRQLLDCFPRLIAGLSKEEANTLLKSWVLVRALARGRFDLKPLMLQALFPAELHIIHYASMRLALTKLKEKCRNLKIDRRLYSIPDDAGDSYGPGRVDLTSFSRPITTEDAISVFQKDYAHSAGLAAIVAFLFAYHSQMQFLDFPIVLLGYDYLREMKSLENHVVIFTGGIEPHLEIAPSPQRWEPDTKFLVRLTIGQKDATDTILPTP